MERRCSHDWAHRMQRYRDNEKDNCSPIQEFGTSTEDSERNLKDDTRTLQGHHTRPRFGVAPRLGLSHHSLISSTPEQLGLPLDWPADVTSIRGGKVRGRARRVGLELGLGAPLSPAIYATGTQHCGCCTSLWVLEV